MNLTKIEAIMPVSKLRVAAYCRVSTASDEQKASLDTQKTHYETYIRSNHEWKYAGLYYDEGISGTSQNRRNGLLALNEPIVSHEVFDKANEIIKLRRKGKCDTKKYQNRYGFSGKIICGECGSVYKRRIHYTVSGSYTA